MLSKARKQRFSRRASSTKCDLSPGIGDRKLNVEIWRRYCPNSVLGPLNQEDPRGLQQFSDSQRLNFQW
jgi:hypothetical protein